MNVLVYSGPGTSPDSVKHCLESLRNMLSPYYAVVSVDSKTLLHEPWSSKTSAVVFPGGADLPMCKELGPTGVDRITKYVKKGGRYIGFCAGGYFGSARCEFAVGDPSMEVSGPRELKLFPGTCRGPAFSGFKYHTEEGSRATILQVNTNALPGAPSTVYNYYNGGGVFVDAESATNVEVLAGYTEELDVDHGSGIPAAAVYTHIGNGAALLTGTHPEFTPVLMKRTAEDTEFTRTVTTLSEHDEQRQNFLKACLEKLGLKVNEQFRGRPSLTPLFLTSLDPQSSLSLLRNIERNVDTSEPNILEGTANRFRVHVKPASATDYQIKGGYEDPDTAVIDVVAVGNDFPDKSITPYFDIGSYYEELVHCWQPSGAIGEFGNPMVYGEVLTSTSVLMDKNTNILKQLPNGFAIHGTTQVIGRGRGGNVWINPPGVLAVSVLMKMEIENAKRAPLVFYQYLATMAYVEAALNYDSDGSHAVLPIRIKWPNDIYILKPEYVASGPPKNYDTAYTKIGGILINTHVFDSTYYIIAGCGLNVSNAAPTTSLNQVLDSVNATLENAGRPRLSTYKPEKLMARFLWYFESMVNRFKQDGFSPFLDLYYRRWLHGGQIVWLQDKGNARAKITGITSDWGLLKAAEVDVHDIPTGVEYELQPDGNSFDMFSGLISTKYR